MTKKTLLLSVFFILFNGIIYIATELNKEQRIKLVLDDNIKTLQTHYEILLHTQEITALTIYQSTISEEKVLEIMSEARGLSQEKQAPLRDKMQKLLTSRYDRAKQKDVLQYQFIFPDNRVFLRMHKPEKFGDDLTEVREDFKYVNETKKPARVFTQGRTAHGFRNAFPLFDKKGNHIGAMEVSFSSDSFQWYLNHISRIHTHFLVDKAIFNAKTWLRDDLILQYFNSSESSKFMITLGDIHTKEKCIDENRLKLATIKDELDFKIKQGNIFAIYVKYSGEIEVVSFLPIKNLKEETIAWLVSYEDSPFIYTTLRGVTLIRTIMFFISIVLIYSIVLQLRSRAAIESKNKLLHDILNETDNIMFITDFKSVKFSNNRFKELINVASSRELNEKVKNNLATIFNNKDGYLHSGLLQENEDFSSLVERTSEDERVVRILDRDFEEKVFNISISRTNRNHEFLVTLSDITKLKAKQELTEKKAYFDGLTNVYNRNKFDEILEVEIQRSKRYSHPLSIAIIDIDKFKNFNDTYGHLIGDEVLILMANSVNKSVRTTDTFARWGGEEFVILFRDTLVEDAKVVSEKLKDTISKLSHHTAGSVTASFGVTSYREGDTSQSLFKRCDEALYLAKENGRNKVEVL